MEGLRSGNVHDSLRVLQSSPKMTAYEDMLGLSGRRRKDQDVPTPSATTSTVPVVSDHGDIYMMSRPESLKGAISPA